VTRPGERAVSARDEWVPMGQSEPPTDAERILSGLDDIASQVERGRYEIRDTITVAALIVAASILLHGCMT
jgi:hypothetical protein